MAQAKIGVLLPASVAAVGMDQAAALREVLYERPYTDIPLPEGC